MSTGMLMNSWFESKEESGKYDCMDNYREGRLDDHKAMLKYQQAYKEGCCGSVDEIISDDCGNLWAVGFNYGH